MPDPLTVISNGEFELGVCAKTGRIMRYGRVGGANLLWENHLASPETPSPFPGWINWGGDKVWIWPEKDWLAWTGLNAPPGDPPSYIYDIVRENCYLRMTSPVICEYGVRIVREITLRPEGSTVVMVNHLKRVNAPVPAVKGPPKPIGVWQVTQMPAAARVFAALSGEAISPKFEMFAEGGSFDVNAAANVAVLKRPVHQWAKVGLEADTLAVPVGEHLFIARVLERRGIDMTGREPFRRAQVFSDPDDSQYRPAGLPPYVEMEFTSTVRHLEIGESVSLTVSWEAAEL